VAVGALVGGINISLYLYFSTGSFKKEYEQEVSEVTKVLFEEQKGRIQELVDIAISEPEVMNNISEIHDELESISSVGYEVEAWSRYVRDGKGCLRRSSICVLIAGILAAVSLFAVAPDTGPFPPEFLIFSGAMCVFLIFMAASNMKSYGGICHRIDHVKSQLSIGKSIADILEAEHDERR